ncbi:O-succinylbenzoate synthase [Mesobacillus campisalis]|uniref:o-succinylbenzoate synthase n=1 Tax=Mesobacillus campisalis TaxID=1408103 RepID=A0A0M2SPN1_9BACI|nr:o-succinylbenzoate synthase [Mesobacillus campisalis]KKK36213.1 O-succinylbenzoate synthase [Mesobacillus campisalis]
MKISSIVLKIIKMPLKSPFSTHLEKVLEREAIIVEIRDRDGLRGYGEGVAFSSPWYTEETVKTSWHMLKDFFIPELKRHGISTPVEAAEAFKKYRGNHMAKAAVETALWDLQAKRDHRPLSRLLGSVRESIPSGVVVAAPTTEEAVRQTEAYVRDGYKRVKIKISPDNDLKLVSELRNRFPGLDLMADANSAYSLEDVGRLKALDEFGLLMLEQPLAHDDIIDHAKLQRQLSTPICLDESIGSLEDARRAVELGSCRVINIKIGRVGGLLEAMKIHDYCYERNIPVWCGGMIEFGISRAHNIALASLPGFTIPGDISGSDRYWTQDIITPEIKVNNGEIEISRSAGIGYDINEKRLREVTVKEETFAF